MRSVSMKEVIASQQKKTGGAGSLSEHLKTLGGMKPNIGQMYNRAADTSIAASGQRADRAGANFMAHGGGRMGAAGQLMAGEQRANDMTGAQAAAGGLRAQGAEAQFGAELSLAQLIAQITQQQADNEARLREQRLRERQFLSQGRRAQNALNYQQSAPGFYNQQRWAMGDDGKDARMQSLLAQIAGLSPYSGG